MIPRGGSDRDLTDEEAMRLDRILANIDFEDDEVRWAIERLAPLAVRPGLERIQAMVDLPEDCFNPRILGYDLVRRHHTGEAKYAALVWWDGIHLPGTAWTTGSWADTGLLADALKTHVTQRLQEDL